MVHVNLGLYSDHRSFLDSIGEVVLELAVLLSSMDLYVQGTNAKSYT